MLLRNEKKLLHQKRLAKKVIKVTAGLKAKTEHTEKVWGREKRREGGGGGRERKGGSVGREGRREGARGGVSDSGMVEWFKVCLLPFLACRVNESWWYIGSVQG
jgi:hypothetical protein